MDFFTGGITTAGHAAVEAASANSLELGYVRIGSHSLASGANIGNSSTNAAGTIVQLEAENVFYTIFGSNRFVIFVELEMDASLTIGNVMFFLSDGTPFAWGLFDYNIIKAAKDDDTAGDWIMLALSVEKTDLVGKFNLDPAQSTAFELPVAANPESAIVDFSQNRKIVAAVNEIPDSFDLPAFMFKGRKWFINPFMFPADQDLSDMTGGTVGDEYDRSI